MLLCLYEFCDCVYTTNTPPTSQVICRKTKQKHETKYGKLNVELKGWIISIFTSLGFHTFFITTHEKKNILHRNLVQALTNTIDPKLLQTSTHLCYR